VKIQTIALPSALCFLPLKINILVRAEVTFQFLRASVLWSNS